MQRTNRVTMMLMLLVAAMLCALASSAQAARPVLLHPSSSGIIGNTKQAPSAGHAHGPHPGWEGLRLPAELAQETTQTNQRVLLQVNEVSLPSPSPKTSNPLSTSMPGKTVVKNPRT